MVGSRNEGTVGADRTCVSSRTRWPIGCVGCGGRRNVRYVSVLRSSGEMTFFFGGSVLAQPANPWLERTAGQRCWPVPSALRATAAAQPQRWAAFLDTHGSMTTTKGNYV